jgi:CRP-like cAMP-binding protein
MAVQPGLDARDFLKQVPLFANSLDAGQIDFLAEHSHFTFFRAGTLLMSQGDFGASMFAIAEGRVSVTFVDPEGREKVVATLGPRDVVGEMSLFTGDRRTANVSAVSSVTALEIGKASLERVFARSPGLLDRFGAVLAARQAELAALASPRGVATREDFVRRARTFFTGLFGRGARI